MADKAVVEARGIWYRHDGQPVLEGVDLTVREGDFYAIIGPNGGGKTTLLRIVLGLLQPSAGTVLLFSRRPEESRGLVGYVPQFRTFDFRYPITVEEMVLSGRLACRGGSLRRYRAEDRESAARILGELGLDHLAGRPISRLSGGEQQRAILARALVGEPRLLILDEPTVYVDAPTEVQFFDLLDRLRRSLTIVLVSHDIGVISRHVTRVACLNRTLFTHDTPEITEEMITAAYRCPVDLIAHGLPHRVLGDHHGGGGGA
jgi:zinc transport system ATP-binding protein